YPPSIACGSLLGTPLLSPIVRMFVIRPLSTNIRVGRRTGPLPAQAESRPRVAAALPGTDRSPRPLSLAARPARPTGRRPVAPPPAPPDNQQPAPSHYHGRAPRWGGR